MFEGVMFTPQPTPVQWVRATCFACDARWLTPFVKTHFGWRPHDFVCPRCGWRL